VRRRPGSEFTKYRSARSGILSGANAFATWKATYRPRFYQRFKVVVPAGMLPQTRWRRKILMRRVACVMS
jgi:hypothetical protein